MLQGSSKTIWPIPLSLPLTEGNLRPRREKGFGPGHTAPVTETGLELGPPDFPDRFSPGHFLGRQQGKVTGEEEEREGAEGLGTVRQEVCGASPTAGKRPAMPFQRDILSRCNFSHCRHYFLSRADCAGLRDKAPRHVHTKAAKT